MQLNRRGYRIDVRARAYAWCVHKVTHATGARTGRIGHSVPERTRHRVAEGRRVYSLRKEQSTVPQDADAVEFLYGSNVPLYGCTVSMYTNNTHLI